MNGELWLAEVVMVTTRLRQILASAADHADGGPVAMEEFIG